VCINRGSGADAVGEVQSLRSARRADVEQFVARRTVPLVRAMEQLTVAQRNGVLAGLRAWAGEIEA
jgi:hypothetical protein